MDGALLVMFHPIRTLGSLVIAVAVAASVSVGALAQSASGQIGDAVDCAIASQQNFPPDDLQRIRDFVGKNASDLGSDDPALGGAARDRLLKPLNCKTVSVAFRMKYGEILWGGLGQYINLNTEPRIAANVLRIMGRARSIQSVQALRAGLSDSRPVVRFAATVGYRELLAKPALEGWAINRGNRKAVLTALQDALVNEPDPLIVSGVVVALSAVDDADASMRADAMTRLAQGLSVRHSMLKVDELSVAEVGSWARCYRRALISTRAALLQQIGGPGQMNFAARAAVFGGHGAALVRDLMNRKDIADNKSIRAQLADVASVAEMVVVLGTSSVGQPAQPPGLRKLFERGDRADFEKAIAPWISASGRLTQPPFDARAEDFAPVK